MTEIEKSDPAHDEFASLLPWYVSGRLSEKEQAMIDTHLGHCTVCRDEVTGLRNLSTGVKTMREDETPLWAPSAAHFTKLSALVDAASAPATKTAPRTAKPGWMQRLREWFDIAPPSMRFAMGMQAVVIVALAGVLWRQSSAPQMYETFSRTAQQSAETHLRVGFAPDATEQDMRAVLQQIHARIVNGPNSFGIYDLHIESASAETVLQARDTLRTNAKVRFAELHSGTN